MSERRRSAFWGMLFGYATLAVSLARNVLLVPVYLRTIPLGEYGAWLATGGALALILVNDYGFSGVVQQRLAASHGARDLGAIGRWVGSSLAIGLVLALGLSAISLALTPLLPGLGELDGAQHRVVTSCFVLAIAANGLGVLGSTAGSVIRSLQRPIPAGLIVVAGELANLGVIIAGLVGGFGLYAIAAGLVIRSSIMTLAGGVCVWWLCARELRVRIRAQPAAIRELLGESGRFFATSISIRLMAQANVFFVDAVLGGVAAAVYSLTVRAYDTAAMLVNSLTGALVAPITHLLGSGDVTRFRSVVLRMFVLTSAFVAFLMTVTLILDPAFLDLWVGPNKFAGQTVSVLVAVGMFVSLSGSAAYDALLAQGKFGLISRYFLAASVLQVALLAAFLRFGLWTAPLATLLSSVLWGLGFWRSLSADIGLGGTPTRELIGELTRIVIVCATCAVSFMKWYPPAGGWPAFIGEGVVCSLVLAAGLLSASPRLRAIAHEEIGLTSRLFRAT